MKVKMYRDKAVKHWGREKIGNRWYIFLGYWVVEIEVWEEMQK